MTAIMGIFIQNNQEENIKMQELFSKFGCSITTRICFNHRAEYSCAKNSIMIIEVVEKINEIYDELSKYWNVQIMKFD